MQVFLAPCCSKGGAVPVISEILFSCVHPKNCPCMFPKLSLMSAAQSQMGNHQMFSTWAVSLGMWGSSRCILPSLTLKDGKWHRSGTPGQKCLSPGFPQPGAYKFSYFVKKCSPLVEDRIRWYVEVLTQICQSQASRLQLCSVGNEKPFQQVVHLNSILNSSSDVCICIPVGMQREL